MRLLLTTLLCLTTTTVLAIEYQGAQAPPPAPNSCQGWCPKWTCCKLCDDPACSGCGATRQCAGQPAATAAAATPTSTTNAATSTTSAAASSIVAPGFQTGVDGKLRANGKPFVIKGINWWTMAWIGHWSVAKDEAVAAKAGVEILKGQMVNKDEVEGIVKDIMQDKGNEIGNGKIEEAMQKLSDLE